MVEFQKVKKHKLTWFAPSLYHVVLGSVEGLI